MYIELYVSNIPIYPFYYPHAYMRYAFHTKVPFQNNHIITSQIYIQLHLPEFLFTHLYPFVGVSCGPKKVELTLGGHAAGRSSLEIKPKLEMLHQIMNDVVNPIELLCQTLNMDCLTRESLDMELSDIFTNGGKNPLSAFVDANFDYTAGMLTIYYYLNRFGHQFKNFFSSTLVFFRNGTTH